MKNFSSIIGWLILICVLAVPAFLFYNWMSSKKAEQTVQTRPVAEQAKFFNSEDKTSPAQPGDAGKAKPQESRTPPVQQQAQVQTAAAQVQPVTAPQVSQPAGQSPSASSQAPQLPPEAASQQKQPDLTQNKPLQASATQAVTVSTMSYYAPKTSRDPTLTPKDYEKMREEENKLRMAQKQREMDAKRRKMEESPTVKLKLQGVVGASAIINGEMVNEGQSFRGFKVTKVGANYVIGVYNGKKYRLTLE